MLELVVAIAGETEDFTGKALLIKINQPSLSHSEYRHLWRSMVGVDMCKYSKWGVLEFGKVDDGVLVGP